MSFQAPARRAVAVSFAVLMLLGTTFGSVGRTLASEVDLRACESLLGARSGAVLIQEATGEDENGGVRVNGVAVTDERWYKTSDVLRALRITPDVLANWAKASKSVYSIGEGAGGLLPHLLSQGVDVRGIDLWYHQKTPFPANDMGQAMKAYQEKYGPYLLQGDALNLSLATDSVDVIVSNKLINNLEGEERIKFISEVLRVLKPGGEARIDFLNHERMYVDLNMGLNERFPKAGIYEFNEEGDVSVVGSLEGAAFKMERDYESGVLFIHKRKPFAEFQ